MPASALQVKAGSDWDGLVANAFASMDPGSDGVLSADDLERLLCGEDGCEVRSEGMGHLLEPLCTCITRCSMEPIPTHLAHMLWAFLTTPVSP